MFSFHTRDLWSKRKDSVIFCPLVQVNLAAQAPEGDLKDYFGINSNIGCSIGIKKKKSIL